MAKCHQVSTLQELDKVPLYKVRVHRWATAPPGSIEEKKRHETQVVLHILVLSLVVRAILGANVSVSGML